MILTTVFLIIQLLAIVCFRPYLSWEDAKLNDLIEFINDCNTDELEKNLRISKNVDDPNRNDMIQIIQKYWDCFLKEGV